MNVEDFVVELNVARAEVGKVQVDDDGLVVEDRLDGDDVRHFERHLRNVQARKLNPVNT